MMVLFLGSLITALRGFHLAPLKLRGSKSGPTSTCLNSISLYKPSFHSSNCLLMGHIMANSNLKILHQEPRSDAFDRRQEVMRVYMYERKFSCASAFSPL